MPEPRSDDPDRTRRRGRLSVLAGAALLAGASLLAWDRVEAYGVWYYHLAWAGTLAALAGGLAWRTGRPPFDVPLALSLFFWSATFWYLFEFLNLRLANWYYVFVPRDVAVRWGGTWLAFATVLPALYLGYRWAARLGLAEGWSRPTFRVRPAHRRVSTVLGVGFVAFAVWRPEAFFPLVWGALTLLLEPWNHARDPGTSLLGDLSRGRYARIVRLLAGGLFIGGLWELYNALAAARWIYTVPGLEGLKLFEMPVPGFLGFPVLALDGYVTYRALEGLGVAARGWDEGDPEPPSRPAGPRPVRCAAAGLAALAFCAAVQAGVDRWTVDSTWPRLEELPGVDADASAALRRAGLGSVGSVARRDSADLARRGLPPAAAGPAARSADLVWLRGLGAANARALWRAGIRSVCDLAGARQAEVSAAVRRARASPRAGEAARVRVWLRAARQRCPVAGTTASGSGRRRLRAAAGPTDRERRSRGVGAPAAASRDRTAAASMPGTSSA